MIPRLPPKLCLLLLGLPGCAVYMPMQCAAPAVHDKGQVEVSGSWYLNNRVEAGVDYSPVRHLLVRAAGGGVGDRADSSYYRGSQYEVALGTYWPIGQKILVGALGGVGQAQGQARYEARTYLSAPSTQYQLDARYNKFFGEAYGTVRVGPAVSLGIAYRLTQVRFTNLTNLGYAVGLNNMLRGEPMFFVRGAFGSSPSGERPVHAQFGMGTSRPLDRAWSAHDAGPEAQVLQSRVYFTLGLGLSLNSLFQRP